MLCGFGYNAQSKPQVGLTSLYGSRIYPDVGLRTGYGTTTLASRGLTVDTVLEVKVQEVWGSCDQKIVASIHRHAQVWDGEGTAAAIVHLLCPKVVGRDHINYLARLAEQNRVGFINADGLTPAVFDAELVRLANSRRAAMASRAAERLANVHTAEDLAAALRLAERRESAPATSGSSTTSPPDLSPQGTGAPTRWPRPTLSTSTGDIPILGSSRRPRRVADMGRCSQDALTGPLRCR